MMAGLFKHREALLLVAIVLLVGAIELRFPGFIAPRNLVSIYNDTAILIILALGQAAVILSRGIDLSIAANLALSGTIAALLNVAFPDLPVILLLAASVASGTLLGAINGLLVWRLSIPPIVVTLGTMTIYRGTIFLLTDGAWVNAHEMTAAFKAVPRATFLDLPVLSWVSLAAIAAMVVVFVYTRLGRAFYAVGGNPHAAVYTGISVGRTHFFAYLIAGSLAGLAGYLWVARYAVAYVDIASGFELDVVAACVIGGISIAGGAGTAIGAVLGALFLGIIKNALPVINISPFWQMAISGAVIIIAVIVNARGSRVKGRVILKKAEHAL
ncbi:ABC transporter permease [Martelella endophytica]|uniref:Branched-chain amino acid ABC transporter permease n=1 Tax=Martelella endophytica TaxID=1486262 RepID=A0A0D5LMS6_MAREN|nr:ABC transporter permease [Martelella endophytica]AJY45504.1 branched-chain amino acid ABC transporter permease [Martelella endophytica]